MFTGIITDIGRVAAVDTTTRDPTYLIETRWDTEGIALGASIACSGVCLTVIERGPFRFKVQASAETLGLTTVKHWREGTLVNLERALRLGDELGGHLVSGHVDGIGTIVARGPENDSVRYSIEVPAPLARFIARKGSVAVDGVSLTVNEVEGNRFGVNIIPHTQAQTGFGEAGVGDEVNIEIDTLARYVARLVGTEGP
jgi:riboflavin synthase